MANYPNELLNQMNPGDNVVSFLPLEMRSKGCMGESSRPGGFVAVTEQRLIFKGTVVERTGIMNNPLEYSETTSNVPISKVSSMSVTSVSVKGGCGGKSTIYTLSLNVQGGVYNIYVGKNRGTADAFVRSFIEITE